MRIRTIKPEFFTHEGLFDAERETKLPLRIAYAGLWCAADREGRFRWEPRRLGVSILPYDNIDFSRVLDALSTRGFLVKYRVGSAWFGEVPSFRRHQVINNRESESTLPGVSESDEVIDGASRVPHACPTRAVRAQAEGKGREGREGKGKDASARDAIEVVFPTLLDTPEFRTTWNEYIAYRKRKKLSTLLPESVTKQFSKLSTWGVADAITSINETISNGWQGLFEPKRASGQSRAPAQRPLNPAWEITGQLEKK